MFCKAFEENYLLESTSSIRQNGFSSRFESVESLVHLNITGLQPATSYDIYCYTEDFQGNVMYLEDVIPTFQQVDTSGTRALVYTKVAKVIDVLDSLKLPTSIGTFEFMLNAKPLQPRTVEIDIEFCPDDPQANVEGVTPMEINVVPNIFAFDQNSLSVSGRFQVRSMLNSDEGCVKLVVRNQENTYDSDSVIVHFINNRKILPAPTLETVVFSDKGTSLNIFFDIEKF